jgi:DNA-binding CsgD family transcriptional regulator
MYFGNDRASESPRLTPRELEILSLTSEGHSSKEIGAVLFISSRTVDFHRASKYTKLDVTTRLAAFHRATAPGLLPSGGAG